MVKIFLRRWLVLGLLLLAATGQANTVKVDGVRLWPSPTNTRLVFDLSGPVDYSYFSLSNPDRLVIDLNGAQLNTNLALVELANSGITGLRSGPREGGIRVVLDLEKPVPARAFVLPPNEQHPNRLVVDLEQAQSLPPVAATERTLTTDGRRDLIIVIDAGHGGEDPGAIGPRGTFEKDVVFRVSNHLKDLVAAEPGMTPVMVRSSDYFVSLWDRRDRARRERGDVFVSIHADAFHQASANGASVYALSDRGATSTTAAYLAEQENRADIIGGVGGVSLEGKDELLREVLVDLSMSANRGESLRLGADIVKHLGAVARLHKPTVEQAAFAVLRSPDVPSVLVEVGFISNPAEEQRLRDDAYRRRLAQSIFQGIKEYSYRSPPEGSYVYWVKNGGQPSAATASAGTGRYTVRAGDTLSAIANRHNTSVSELMRLNDLTNANQLRVGQTLRVPNV